MIYLAIFIALVLERVFPQFVDLRRFDWLRDYSGWLVDVLHIERFGRWGSVAALLFPLLLAVWMVGGLFENALFGLFELAFDVAILFFMLGPKLLDRQIDDYLDALDIGDDAQRHQLARSVDAQISDSHLPGEAEQLSQSLFVEANRRTYALLFWFALFGPVAAVFYRVLQQLTQGDVLDGALSNIRPQLKLLIGILDWIPVRITLFCYMVSGNFDAALQAYRRGVPNAVSLDEQNGDLLKIVGFSAIGSNQGVDGAQTALLIRKSRGLVLRSLVVWLFIIALLMALG